MNVFESKKIIEIFKNDLLDRTSKNENQTTIFNRF